MSGEGFFYSPEDQASMQALKRRQAYAQALLAQGSENPGSGAYAGLRNAGSAILGAVLSNKATGRERDLYKDIQDRNTRDLESFYGSVLGGGANAPQPSATAPAMGAALQGKPSPQISNNPGNGPVMPTEGGEPAPQPFPPMQMAPAATPQNPMQALIATHNPALMAQFGPSLLNHQMNVNARRVIPLSDDEAKARGLRPGGVYGREAETGNLTIIQPSDMKSEGAVQQGYDIARNTPLTQAQIAANRRADAAAAETRRHNMVSERAALNPFGIGLGAPGGDAKTGDVFLSTLPPGLAAQIKAVGTYRQPAPAGRTSPTGIKFMTLVNQAYPDYDASQYGAKTKARNDFTVGKNGNTVRSLNVAVQHLDQLGQLSDAMANGNVQAVNKIGNIFATQTGNPAPTNFNAAKQLVGDEIVKAIVGAGGGVSDREEAAHNISAASSPQQLAGVIKTYQGLLAGQLVGLRQQYQKSTGLNDFEDFLAPETRLKLESHGAPKPSRYKIEQVQ